MEPLPRPETVEGAFARDAARGLPDRLPWPLAALAIAGMSVLLWILILGGFRVLI